MREPFKNYPDDVEALVVAAEDDAKTLAVHLAMVLTGDGPGVKKPTMPLPAVINAIIEVYGDSPSVVHELYGYLTVLRASVITSPSPPKSTT